MFDEESESSRAYERWGMTSPSTTNASVRRTPLLRSLALGRADNISRAFEAESWWPESDRQSVARIPMTMARRPPFRATSAGLSQSCVECSMSTLSLISVMCR